MSLRHADRSRRLSYRCVAVIAIAVAASAVAPTSAASKGSAFNGGRAYEDLRQIVAFGPRPSGSPALDRTRAYIKRQLEDAGLKTEEQPFDAQTPLGPVHMINLRATLPGVVTDRGRIVIGGHYDTKLFREFPFVGASDGGSSAAFLIELARALRGRRNALPIELLFLDGEEAVVEWSGTDHTYGSRYYVAEAKRTDKVKDIRAFILVDMIGDRDLGIRREQHSTAWLTDAIWSAARRLQRPEFLEETTPIEDDHEEFLAAGIPSVDVIDLEYPAWHRADDRLDHVAASSLQAVGDVLLEALPAIEAHLK
jgi:glutaminyl-peptide cyclotransferase